MTDAAKIAKGMSKAQQFDEPPILISDTTPPKYQLAVKAPATRIARAELERNSHE